MPNKYELNSLELAVLVCHEGGDPVKLCFDDLPLTVLTLLASDKPDRDIRAARVMSRQLKLNCTVRRTIQTTHNFNTETDC